MNVPDTRPFFKPGRPAYHTVPIRVRHLKNARVVSQLFFLGMWFVFFFLCRAQEHLPFRPDLFLVSDPLVAMLTMGASRVLVPMLGVSIFFVVFTLIFGRAFCSWICPLGTLIDGAKHVFKPKEDRFSQGTHEWMQSWKYYMVVFMAFGALVGSQWVYLFDPLVLMFRGFTSLWPVAASATPAAMMPAGLGAKMHDVPLLPIALLFVSIGLTAVTPRFWCRYLCPLGAFYGLLSKQPLLRRRVKGCDICKGREVEKECVSGCRTNTAPRKSVPHRSIRASS